MQLGLALPFLSSSEQPVESSVEEYIYIDKHDMIVSHILYMAE